MKVVRIAGALALLAACSTRETGGPQITMLSPEGARDVFMQYSLDGSHVAFWSPAQEGGLLQLWMANGDFTGRKQLPVQAVGTFPIVWSSDGTRIATSSSEHGTAQVVVIAVSDGSVRQVTQGKNLAVPEQWHPKGDRLGYIQTIENGGLQSYVYTFATNSSAPALKGESRFVQTYWSPDGSKIAYNMLDNGKYTIWVADSAGENRRQLTKEGFEAFWFGNSQVTPWSPDSKEIVYESRRTGTSDIWVLPVDGSVPRQLTRDIRNDRDPVWSPDGKTIAFISERGRQTDVWVVPAAGGEERRVTDDDATQEAPAWRGGTNQLAFVTRTQRASIWTHALDGGAEKQLTPDSLLTTYFTLSPDGKQAAYVVTHSGGIEDLAVMPIDGGPSRTLIAGGGTVANPLWSPDGAKIVFGSDRGGSPDIWVIDAAGGTPRQLTNWPGFEYAPTWSKDGKSVYFAADHESHLADMWVVPADGGEPKRITTSGNVNGTATRTGGADTYVMLIAGKGGQFTWHRLLPDGKLGAVWDRTNALGFIAPLAGDSAAITTERASGGFETRLVSIHGGGEGRVILKAGEFPQQWSADGKSLLYYFTVGGANDIGILDVKTGATKRLTTTPQSENGAEFTPDGKTVVFRRAQTIQRVGAVDVTKLMAAGK